MTIDETIAHEKRLADIYKANCECELDDCCKNIIGRHEQIAEWLEELKDYRNKNKMVVRIDAENMDSIKDKIEELSRYAESQYNKGIDDFVNFANTMPTVEESGTIRPMWLEEMAERLKVGGDCTKINT